MNDLGTLVNNAWDGIANHVGYRLINKQIILPLVGSQWGE